MCVKNDRFVAGCQQHSGGYSDGVPPLPIPNREVKPVCADGTAMQCGRVGSRLLLQKTLDNRNVFQGLFFVLQNNINK